MNKRISGKKEELKQSLYFHRKYVPLLLSPLVLRDYGCGQIDLAIFKDEGIELIEVKSNSAFVSLKQKRRLKKTQSFLSAIFNKRVSLLLVTGKKLICQIY